MEKKLFGLLLTTFLIGFTILIVLGRNERTNLYNRIAKLEQKMKVYEEKTSSPLQMPKDDFSQEMEDFFTIPSFPSLQIPKQLPPKIQQEQNKKNTRILTFQGTTIINNEKITYSFSIQQETLRATIQATKPSVLQQIKKKLTDLNITITTTTDQSIEFEVNEEEKIREILQIFGIKY